LTKKPIAGFCTRSRFQLFALQLDLKATEINSRLKKNRDYSDKPHVFEQQQPQGGERGKQLSRARKYSDASAQMYGT